jgi:hypothetical protein
MNNQRKGVTPRGMNLITEIEGLRDWIFTQVKSSSS